MQLLCLSVHLLSAIPTFGPCISLENRNFYLCSLTEVNDFIIVPLIKLPLLFHGHQPPFFHNESVWYNPCKLRALSCSLSLISWQFINEKNFFLTFPEISVGFIKKTAKLPVCMFCWKQNKLSTFDTNSQRHIWSYISKSICISAALLSQGWVRSCCRVSRICSSECWAGRAAAQAAWVPQDWWEACQPQPVFWSPVLWLQSQGHLSVAGCSD